MYVYHYQNAENNLVFRYDNAAHKPALQHPHHKHVPTGIEFPSVPTPIDAIDEILNY
ncbi:MAG: toxin-antitoxin system TumE family protein [Candidatus Latescibacterota bacterium]